MNIDASEFPFVWMRDGDRTDDEESEQQVFLDLLAGGRRFVLIAARMPSLSDLGEMTPDQRKARAVMFKQHRAAITRLCAAMIMVGDGSRLPAPIKAAIEGLSGAIGVPMVFVPDAAAALALGTARLAE
tara:strand:- start:12122 stop:12508 length:387 start_codon:yes stop_codon:yes gene_type:complete